MVLDMILLAPAIEFGKEMLVLFAYRSDLNRVAQSAGIQLTSAEYQANTTILLRAVAGLGTLIFLLACPYYILTESSTLQGTLGKRILGLRVTDLNGRRIRLGRAILRYLARMVSAMPWQFGFIMAGFTSKKRALHDFLAGTLVRIDEKAGPAEEYAAPGSICSACSGQLMRDAAFCTWCGAAVSGRIRAHYARFGRRTMAALLDFIFLMPVLALLLIRFPNMSPAEMQTTYKLKDNRLTGAEREDAQMLVTRRGVRVLSLVFLVFGVYSTVTESSALQGTLGKGIFGLRVTDLNGRRIRLGRAALRHLARILSAALWFVGFIMARFTPRKQALHDILVGTLVVRVEETAVEIR